MELRTAVAAKSKYDFEIAIKITLPVPNHSVQYPYVDKALSIPKKSKTSAETVAASKRALVTATTSQTNVFGTSCPYRAPSQRLGCSGSFRSKTHRRSHRDMK